MEKSYELKIDIAQKVLGLGKDNVSAELWKAADKVLTDFLNPIKVISKSSPPWDQDDPIPPIPGF